MPADLNKFNSFRVYCTINNYMRKLPRHTRIARYILYKETLIDPKEHLWTFIGSFLGIGIIGYLSSTQFSAYTSIFLIGSFGASAVLIYGVINSPLAQPRNLIGGHVISAFIGVSIYKLLGAQLWLSASLSVSISIVVMQITKTLHPPGGATALIANMGGAQVHALGFFYVLSPVLSGVTILLLIALVCNNATPHRSYPKNKNWYKIWSKKFRQ